MRYALPVQDDTLIAPSRNPPPSATLCPASPCEEHSSSSKSCTRQIQLMKKNCRKRRRCKASATGGALLIASTEEAQLVTKSGVTIRLAPVIDDKNTLLRTDYRA